MAGEVVGTAYVEVRPKVDGFANEAQSKIAAPLQAAFGGIATGIVAAKVKSFFTDAFSEATEAAKVTAQTGAVLKSTGEAAGVSAEHIGKLANHLSNLAAVDDEVIQQGENVLLTFTSIRNEAGKGNDVFDRATTAALNMSAALGTDLQGSIIQVGKALQDPIQGLTALRRVGVSFTQSQKDQIAVLQQSGDLLGAQKIILGELEREFGGAAASQATATARLSVAFKNLEESVGTALLPVISGLAKALTPLADFLGQSKVAATLFAVVLSGALLAALAGYTIRMAQATIATLSFKTAQTEAAAASEETALATAGLASGLGLAAGIMGTAAIAGIGLAAALGQSAHGLEVNTRALQGLTREQLAAFAASVQHSGGLVKLEDIIKKIGGTAPETARQLVAAADLPRAARERLLTTIDKMEAAEKRSAAAALSAAGAYDTQSDSTATLVDWQNILIGKLNDQVDASLGSQGAAVSMDRAIQNLNETLATNAANTLEGRDAIIQAEQSVVSFGKKIYDEKVATEGSSQATLDQIGALAGVRDSLAPGSPLRQFLDDYINRLNDTPSVKYTNWILTLSNQTGLSVGDLNSLDVISRITTGAFGASGAIVNRPTVALIGEAGPEALIPLSQTPGNSPLGALGAGEVHIHYDGAGPTNPITAAHTTARVLRVHMALAGR